MSAANLTMDDLGVEPIEGDPSALRAAGKAWAGVGETLSEDGRTLMQACTTAVALDWAGLAAQQYACYSQSLTAVFLRGAAACTGAGHACDHFATQLAAAQKREGKAMWEAFDGLRRKKQAEEDMAGAVQQIGIAKTARASAITKGDHARARPGGDADAASADVELGQAQTSLRAAKADLEAAQAAWKRGTEDLSAGMRAIKHEKHVAKEAGEAARAQFALAGEMARMAVPRAAKLPVPVTVRPWQGSGIPGLPGLGQTPSDLRRQQIDFETKHPGEVPPWLKALQALNKSIGDAQKPGQKADQLAFAIGLADNLKGKAKSKLPGIANDLKRFSNQLSDLKKLAKVSKFLSPLVSALEGVVERRGPEDIAGKVVWDLTIGSIPGADYEDVSPKPVPKVDTTPPGQCK